MAKPGAAREAFGVEIVYSARAPKPFARSLGFTHLELNELLETSDIVTVHIGKGIQIMGPDHFARLPTTTLLVNTSLGPVFEAGAFSVWLDAGGLAVGDATVDPSLSAPMATAPNAWVSPQPAADTVEMKQRKSDQLVENVEAFVSGSPLRVVSGR